MLTRKFQLNDINRNYLLLKFLNYSKLIRKILDENCTEKEFTSKFYSLGLLQGFTPKVKIDR